eukprot:scaffold122656_cov26-Prasinocladus_malaysianus.AAC.1
MVAIDVQGLQSAGIGANPVLAVNRSTIMADVNLPSAFGQDQSLALSLYAAANCGWNVDHISGLNRELSDGRVLVCRILRETVRLPLLISIQ